MSVGPLTLELIIVFTVALLLLHHYGRISKQHPLVTLATLVAWYFSLIIVFILPLDVSSTFYRQCITTIQVAATEEGNLSNFSVNETSSATFAPVTENDMESVNSTLGSILSNQSNGYEFGNFSGIIDHTVNTTQITSTTLLLFNGKDVECEKPWSYVPNSTLPVMWHIVYWTSQILTWLVLPFMQSYVCAGDFTPLGKMKRAIFENAFYYGSYLFIFGGLLIYVAASPKLNLDIAQLKVILITASNTWGLFLLVLLLGYGLVEVPRRMWYASNLTRSTASTYFKLAKLSTEKQEAIEDLEDVLEEVKKISEIVRYNHSSRKYVNIIISKCPDDFQERVVQGMDDFEEYGNGCSRSDLPSEKVLVRIHRQVIRAVHTKIRTNVQWRILMERALHLETIAKNLNQIEGLWKDEFPPNDGENCFSKSRALKWHWYCKIQPFLQKIVAVCLALFSLMVVWSECTFFNQNPVLSLFAIFVNLAKHNHDYFYIELVCCLTISYLCVCAYYTVFQIKFFNYYYIAGHHQTDETSLMFVGMMLCRLTAPLCLNFLGLIHLDNHINQGLDVETSYTQIMGHLDVISFVSDGFNIYFPILVCVLCIVTYFHVGQRCLSAVGFQRFIDGSDDMATDLIDEGCQLVNREKRRLQRQLNSMKRSEILINNNTSERWHGRNMQQAEAEKQLTGPHHSTMRYKSRTDKMELLNDAEDIDYNSVTETATAVRSLSGLGSSSQENKSRRSKARPPKNLFDDV